MRSATLSSRDQGGVRPSPAASPECFGRRSRRDGSVLARQQHASSNRNVRRQPTTGGIASGVRAGRVS
jgi:hypothetical protein